MTEQSAYEEDRNIYYMKRALELAGKGTGRTNPNPLAGAVIVKGGRIIGEGWHEKYGCTHAEVNAVNSAAESVKESTVYVNLEPCCHYGKTPPCTELLIREGVKRVVVGTLDPNPLIAGRGAQRLREAGVEVIVGVLDQECKRLNEVFFHYIQTRKPFVVLKAAMSLDGKIAAPSGESRWITGEAAREDVQLLRNRYSAVMTGVGTVIQDDPELTCRAEGGRNPRRIILDSGLRIPPGSKALTDQQKNPTFIACTERASPESADRLSALGAELLYCESKDDRIDLEDLLEKLGGRGIDSVLLEGGSAVNGSAFSQGIVNKIILYVAPKIIGGEKSKTVAGGHGIDRLDQAYPLRINSLERVGEDIKITAYRKEKERFDV
ncbi:MAG TPA: bifunctional diaminohydroxyphosphoribosylaminopyrimidine deaminase/5-amino-6-(5-phosphoribosylamino)uracil reductase RibD [Anaerovoracaceae bacterium]|nr:bifunctional diaminohydroxyphosphoribosylaminopyrimidine deaminase/5-amino-6-(5-phosphoribosylamino)uracil reductase RibD [Anaerovoracaceae bacterium]